ncbi:MAG: DUF4197 domain-containing protein [Candidatus Kapabacteria bacterium]|nr:DUF4197 domain-containing protein [Candidatus Kapabacteria bacterium]
MKKKLIIALVAMALLSPSLSHSASKKAKKGDQTTTKTTTETQTKTETKTETNSTDGTKSSSSSSSTVTKTDTTQKRETEKIEKKEKKGGLLDGLGGLGGGLGGIVDAVKKTTGLSESDASSGIKEALIQGTKKGVNLVSAVDGFYSNPAIKIPLPQEAQVVESTLRKIGMGKQVDEAIVSLNRAAEDASKSATDIFVGAITAMTITDALNIVTGSDETAGTKYLQSKTTPKLISAFSPVITKSLEKTNATKYWSDLMSAYNKIPFVKKVNPNLTQYVTEKAIDGLFKMVAGEEKNIRKDPAARGSDLLKKVFGGK